MSTDAINPESQGPGSTNDLSTLSATSTDVISSDLPSRVEETLRECPRFRIVLIGNSGVGKSSLVKAIFNVSLKDIEINHDRPGYAEIDRGYTSNENQRFILHDSQGFEAGSTENWIKVEKFLRGRSAMALRDQVHAIWLCKESPLEGSRVQQTGDEKLLSLAQKLGIPVVVVFTKYDYLIKEQRKDAKKLSKADIERKAEDCFNDRIKGLKASTHASIVRVSTDKDYPLCLETLQKLTTTTSDCLGATDVSWVIAQRVNVDQKVETSISEEYWRDLAKSVFFEGHTMEECVKRIHDDILIVWNFNDPLKLLGDAFFAQVLVFVNPVLEGHESEVPGASRQDGITQTLDQAATIAKAAAAIATAVGAAPHIAVAAAVAGISLVAIKFLYGKYQKMPLYARYLGAYIVHLICILHCLFTETLRVGSPKALSEELISSALTSYEKTVSLRPRVHELLTEMNFMYGFETGVRELVTEYTTISGADVVHPTYPESERRRRKLGSCIVA
ncbi:hypothetical protein GALMADRAFT_219097 [Galerina marginata CBS 339.88]|uniref:G domain-containing protein n=1 Tax=Galerina marginata (strain CBS 339.88) TaxID=685588 RepID=A0A067U1C6_GALM3|nr:hypothetical protein GALMADRAFT_219097 [Galerina marginata CBS 339.88]